MDDFIINKQKYPKSIHGKQCIGPCYDKNTSYIHPITLDTYKTKVPTCPTENWIDENGDNKINDLCYLPTKGKDDQSQLDLITPIISLNCDKFLKYCYNINSFDEAIDWNTNNNDPLYTQLRIIECAWKNYGKSHDIINGDLIEFYKIVIKKEWIHDIYNNINHFIYIDAKNKTIYLKNTEETYQEEKNNKQNNKVEKINFIIKKFITNDIIYKILNRHIDSNINKWDDVESHNESIKNETIKYIINKIKISID